MQRQYPGFVAAAGAVALYDPLTRAVITTLPFLGNSRKQKLMGISCSIDVNTWDSNLTVLIGNSLPSYRSIDVNPNDINNCDEVLHRAREINYYDLGGLEIQEGDTLTLTFAVGTQLACVLYVDDMEGADPPIPSGNVVTLRQSGTDYGAAAFAAITISTKKLENTRRYSVFKTQASPEGSAAVSLQMTILQCGARTLCIPMGTMVYDKVPFSFSGLEWNQGQVLLWGFAEAAEKADIRLWLIEHADPSQPASPNAPPVNPSTPTTTPGIVGIPQGTGISRSVAVKRDLTVNKGPVKLFGR